MEPYLHICLEQQFSKCNLNEVKTIFKITLGLYLPFYSHCHQSVQWSFPGLRDRLNAEADLRTKLPSLKPDIKDICKTPNDATLLTTFFILKNISH